MYLIDALLVISGPALAQAKVDVALVSLIVSTYLCHTQLLSPQSTHAGFPSRSVKRTFWVFKKGFFFFQNRSVYNMPWILGTLHIYR